MSYVTYLDEHETIEECAAAIQPLIDGTDRPQIIALRYLSREATS